MVVSAMSAAPCPASEQQQAAHTDRAGKSEWGRGSLPQQLQMQRRRLRVTEGEAHDEMEAHEVISAHSASWKRVRCVMKQVRSRVQPCVKKY